MRGTALPARLWGAFWGWYERHYTVNVAVAALLFALQLVHLYWLTADVVALRVLDRSYFDADGALRYAILVIDYTEIPALVGASLVYVNELRRGWSGRALLYLLFLNSQWLHIFWITDEFVVNELSGAPTTSSLPAWLAWTAILIDYLELPVIYDTMRRFVAAVRDRRVAEFLKHDFRED